MSFLPVPVRLTGSSGTEYEGRLEVWYDGNWGSVCETDFDENEAR